MVDVEALEHLAEPWQSDESAVSHAPVWQESRQRREDVERFSAHAGICREEGRNHHVSTVFAHCSVLRIEGIACQCGTCRIYGILILVLHSLAEALKRVAELLERCRVVSVVGVAHALEGRSKTYRSHRERTALRCRHSLIHILHALRRSHRARCVEVYLQVLHRFERHPQLQVLGLR